MEELTAREIGTDRDSHISKALIVYLYVKKKMSDIFSRLQRARTI